MFEKEFSLEWFLHEFPYFKQDVCHTVWFRMVSSLLSIFLARRVTECLVKNRFYTNFVILRKTCVTVIGLELFLH